MSAPSASLRVGDVTICSSPSTLNDHACPPSALYATTVLGEVTVTTKLSSVTAGRASPAGSRPTLAAQGRFPSGANATSSVAERANATLFGATATKRIPPQSPTEYSQRSARPRPSIVTLHVAELEVRAVPPG